MGEHWKRCETTRNFTIHSYSSFYGTLSVQSLSITHSTQQYGQVDQKQEERIQIVVHCDSSSCLKINIYYFGQTLALYIFIILDGFQPFTNLLFWTDFSTLHIYYFGRTLALYIFIILDGLQLFLNEFNPIMRAQSKRLQQGWRRFLTNGAGGGGNFVSSAHISAKSVGTYYYHYVLLTTMTRAQCVNCRIVKIS